MFSEPPMNSMIKIPSTKKIAAAVASLKRSFTPEELAEFKASESPQKLINKIAELPYRHIEWRTCINSIDDETYYQIMLGINIQGRSEKEYIPQIRQALTSLLSKLDFPMQAHLDNDTQEKRFRAALLCFLNIYHRFRPKEGVCSTSLAFWASYVVPKSISGIHVDEVKLEACKAIDDFIVSYHSLENMNEYFKEKKIDIASASSPFRCGILALFIAVIRKGAEKLKDMKLARYSHSSLPPP